MNAFNFGQLVGRTLEKQAGPPSPALKMNPAVSAGLAAGGKGALMSAMQPKPSPLPAMRDASMAQMAYGKAKMQNNPRAAIDAQTQFTAAARKADSANVALGGKPQYGPLTTPDNPYMR